MQEVKQSINLYLPRFQPAKLSKEVKRLMILLTSVVMFSLFLTMMSFFYVSFYEGEKSRAEQEKVELDIALKKAVAQIPSKTKDQGLVRQIDSKDKMLGKKQQVIEYLYRDTINEGESFTKLVSQLSDKKLRSVWLSKIEVLNKGKDIQLSGYAKEADQVSEYIELLGEKESYQGRGFNKIEISKFERWNQFIISTLANRDESNEEIQ